MWGPVPVWRGFYRYAWWANWIQLESIYISPSFSSPSINRICFVFSISKRWDSANDELLDVRELIEKTVVSRLVFLSLLDIPRYRVALFSVDMLIPYTSFFINRRFKFFLGGAIYFLFVMLLTFCKLPNHSILQSFSISLLLLNVILLFFYSISHTAIIRYNTDSNGDTFYFTSTLKGNRLFIIYHSFKIAFILLISSSPIPICFSKNHSIHRCSDYPELALFPHW